jgi:uncharacterized protein (DUF2252 family)
MAGKPAEKAGRKPVSAGEVAGKPTSAGEAAGKSVSAGRATGKSTSADRTNRKAMARAGGAAGGDTPVAVTEAELTREERIAAGKKARKEVPRSSHAEWEPFTGRPDPVKLLQEQAKTRIPELVPIRYGRMSVSPFTFYRGAALLMAADLAHTPSSGLRVQACGDAHLSNFGGFASPERELVFDLNDFDETLPGPWEWDVKRLMASVAVAGRARGFKRAERRDLLLGGIRRYRQAMGRFADMGNLAVWYSMLSRDMLAAQMSGLKAGRRKEFQSRVEKATAKATTKDSMKAFAKLTTRVEGHLQIISDPPVIVRAVDLLPGDEAQDLQAAMQGLFDEYRVTLQDDRRRLLEGYRFVDIARKIVGVGSVGTRCWILLLEGLTAEQDPLFLQFKEAQPSVLEGFTGESEFENHGRRVVEGQRLMQSASDIMLGWLHTDEGLDGRPRDFYGRQLWDWKFSADVDTMTPRIMGPYVEMCAWTLARAHARSGDRLAIASYLGQSDVFDRAIADFAEAYADQNERDYAALLDAIESGRIAAETGI